MQNFNNPSIPVPDFALSGFGPVMARRSAAHRIFK